MSYSLGSSTYNKYYEMALRDLAQKFNCNSVEDYLASMNNVKNLPEITKDYCEMMAELYVRSGGRNDKMRYDTATNEQLKNWQHAIDFYNKKMNSTTNGNIDQTDLTTQDFKDNLFDDILKNYNNSEPSDEGGAGTTNPGEGSSEGEWETGEGGENPGGETGEDGQNPGDGDSGDGGDGGDGGQNPGGGDSGDGGDGGQNPGGGTDPGEGGETGPDPAPGNRGGIIGGLIGGGLLNNLDDLFNDLLNKFFNADNTRPQGVDPLMLDLDGNGIQTTSIYDGYMMDHEVDGFAELSAWVGGNDGILAYDKNGNGIIDNGNELFGDNYIKSDGTKASSGFDALSDLDSNNDGVINSSDEKFSELQVIKADGSIVSASEAGIASINLSSQQTNQTPDANGNTEKIAA